MACAKKIVVPVPHHVLREFDGSAAMERWNRSVLTREAVRMYVKERKKRDMREQMKRGYLEMARVNLALAEEGPLFENGASRIRSHRNE